MRHKCGKQGMSRTLMFENLCGKDCLEDTDKCKHGRRAAMKAWRWNINIYVKDRLL
jgi:hypothetical protein